MRGPADFEAAKFPTPQRVCGLSTAKPAEVGLYAADYEHDACGVAFVARLDGALEGWRKKMLAAKLAPDSDAAAAMRPEELQRLKSLGYVQ